MGNRTSATTSAGAGGIEIDGGGNTLPLGHRLQEYVIEGLIGEGGFGIVYLARDTQLGRVVALKEYMPSSLATRDGAHQVSVRSMRHRETFELGLRSFVNEAQLLASFDHPSLVKVYRFWEQNGTAYMVMPYYQGPTLKQWLMENGARADEGWLLSLLHPLIDALEAMHHERCYHRDIAPDNILLLQQSTTQMMQTGRPPALRPVLLDFGAARRVISDATQALTVILKSGYAPIEQYAESTSMKQGAWTDIYALSAVLYAAITGRAPLPSVSRMVTDDMVPAVQAGAGHYTQEFLAAIDKGLAVRPEHRPQDMAALRQLFSYGAGTLSAAPVTTPVTAPAAPASSALDDDAATVVLPSSAAPSPAPRPSPPSTPPTAPTPPVAALRPAVPVPPIKLLNPDPMPAASRTGLWVAGGLALGVLALAAWWFGLRSHTPAAAPSTDPGVTGSSAASQPVAHADPAVPPASPAVVPPVVAVPFGIVPALQDIVRHADPLLGVNALADKSAIQIGRDRLQFRVKSSQSGYVYVFLAGTDKGHMYLLFPNAIDKDNRIDANKELMLPRKGWQITAGGPPGTNHIVTMVSRLPRDFSQAGLRSSKDDIPEFDLARAEQLWVVRTAKENPFVGQAVCPAQGDCDTTYGASLLTIDEVR